MSFNLASTLHSAVADALRSNPGIIETQNWSLRQKVLAIVQEGLPEVRTKFLRTVAGGSNAEITDRARAVIAPCYATAQPWAPVVGDGCNVWDADGNQLLDFYGCVAVVNLGHSHQNLLDAMEAQSALLLTGGNGCMNPATVRFCERLVQETFGVGMGKVFPCNSGADANETAIRLGSLFAYQSSGIVPDVISIAKGIGGGLPVGACVAKTSVMDLLTSHGNTYGGNAFCMAGALAVLELESQPEFLAHVRLVGGHLLTGLKGLQDKYPKLVSGVRGQGLLAAVNLNSQLIDNKVAVGQLRARGVVVGPLKALGLRISPTLVVTQNQVNRFLTVLDGYFGELAV